MDDSTPRDNQVRQSDPIQERFDRLEQIRAAWTADQGPLHEPIDELIGLMKDLARFPGENPNPVLRSDPNGTVLYANSAACTALFAQEECAGGMCLPDPLIFRVREASNSRERQQLDIPLSGRVYSFDIVPIPEAGYVNLYGRDITQRIQEEVLLQRYRFLSEQARDTLLLLRLSDGRILEANQAAEQAYLYSREELLLLKIGDLRAPETRPMVRSQLVQADKVGILFESIHQRKDGSTFPVEVSSRGVDFGGDRVLLSVIRDISERIRAETNLRESEERNRSLVELSPDAIFVHSDGKIVFINPAGLRLFGAVRPEQLAGMPVLDLIHPDSRNLVARRIEQITRERVSLPPMEQQYIRLDGTVVDTEVMAAPINYDNQPAVLVLARDINERKRAEAALRETEAQASANAAHVELQHYLMEQRERERVQIARDMHDGPMQRLAAVNYTVECILHDTQSEEIRSELRKVEAGLSREIAEIRAYSNHLRPPVLTRFGLEAGIRSYAAVFQELHPYLGLQLDVPVPLPDLSQRVRLALYRICQEALYNVTEHSGASEVTVQLASGSDGIQLEVRDNGAGFAMIPGELELARQGKLGMAGMREYAEAVGGTFQVQSRPGVGTVVRVTAPVDTDELDQPDREG